MTETASYTQHPSRYIASQHLEPENLRGLTSAFQQNPLGLIQLDDFLVSDIAQLSSEFLTRHASYNYLYGFQLPKKPTRDKYEWLSVNEKQRFFRYEMLDANTSNPMHSGAIAFIKLRSFLQSTPFKSFVESVISRTLDAITPVRVHRMHSGDFLKPHTDQGQGREFAFILYLSPDWPAECGGNLHMVDLHGSESVYQPIFNRLLIFDVHKHRHHYISEIVEHSAQTVNYGRISINGWFYQTNSKTPDCGSE